ncbi:hypothetical protein RSOL_068650 [Rhizoctonia solani AG-3 Rhs1AP]|uniref:Uncharacterized protein n=2 Tax=Rhizoctonia solani AG-3 TaxID=1086053 RepID=A0A074RJG6_9AGAM|nr:hypothetical protein RSOL_068650 [Rhizoctonia solani AG-3 Rhs1AP]KEP46959.1 hypothetical protein V565_173760 [Rhizoctonia solani 123E]
MSYYRRKAQKQEAGTSRPAVSFQVLDHSRGKLVKSTKARRNTGTRKGPRNVEIHKQPTRFEADDFNPGEQDPAPYNSPDDAEIDYSDEEEWIFEPTAPPEPRHSNSTVQCKRILKALEERIHFAVSCPALQAGLRSYKRHLCSMQASSTPYPLSLHFVSGWLRFVRAMYLLSSHLHSDPQNPSLEWAILERLQPCQPWSIASFRSRRQEMPRNRVGDTNLGR